MRRLWVKVLFVVSLCLNAGFLAAMGVHAVQHRRGHGMQDLQLTAQAKAQMETNFKAFRERAGAMDADLRAERLKMLDLLASDNPAPEAITAQEGRVAAATERMLKLTDEHLLDQKKLLNAQQQRLFFDHIRRRIQDPDKRSPFP
jgi:Spy/CpxP family protein refolding chaperone